MRRLFGLDPERIVAAATLALLVAVAGYFVFSALARPAHYATRLTALRQELSQTRDLLHSPGKTGGYDAKALCHGSPDQAALDLRQQIQTRGAAGALAVSELVVAPEAEARSPSALRAVALQFQASGRYEAVVGLLAALAKSRPQIFVDTLDLTPEAAATRVRLTGRILCSTSAHP